MTIGLVCCLWLAPIPAGAQQAPAEGTGATLEAVLVALDAWALGARGGDAGHLPELKKPGNESALRDERTKLFERMRTYRAECRSDLRKANRETKFPTTLRCFRGLLALQLTSLQRWQRFTGNLPGVPPALAEQERQAVAAWAEAIATVLSAVDAGVYQGDAGLRDARNRLTERYGLPAEYARLQTRRALDAGWLMIVTGNLRLLAAEAPTNALTAMETAQCIQTALPAVENASPATPSDLLPITTALSAYEARVPECLTKIKNIAKDISQESGKTGAEAPAAPR